MNMRSTMHLISNYRKVSDFGLREAGMRGRSVADVYSTYDLEYYVAYQTFDGRMIHPNRKGAAFHHIWNCAKDGFPTKANLSRWASRQDQLAYGLAIELIVARAELRRVSNDEVVAEWQV